VRQRSLAQLRQIQLVVQSPDLALNPAQRIGEILRRPLALYFALGRQESARRIGALLEMVELPASTAERFPHELSGGQRQRVSLARALAAEPSLLLCDEVLSSLDTIVAQGVLALLKDLRRRLGVSYLFISHDLATVAELADRVVVLHQGACCEEGEAAALFAAPTHPYTRRLIDSIPELRPGWLEETLMRDRAAP
jgi:peptide/nickel transport system ATP-binding protein